MSVETPRANAQVREKTDTGGARRAGKGRRKEAGERHHVQPSSFARPLLAGGDFLCLVEPLLSLAPPRPLVAVDFAAGLVLLCGLPLALFHDPRSSNIG